MGNISNLSKTGRWSNGVKIFWLQFFKICKLSLSDYSGDRNYISLSINKSVLGCNTVKEQGSKSTEWNV